MMNKMQFEPLYYKEQLTIINPSATLAVVTLWSGADFVYKQLKEVGVDLSSNNSKIVAIGYLRGDGFKFLLRNLLYNPQIDTLLVVGVDRAGSYNYIANFFKKGVESYNKIIKYRELPDRNNIDPVRIKETDYVMDNCVIPSTFTNIPYFERIEGVDSTAFRKAATFIDNYVSKKNTGERIHIEVPEVIIDNFPSNPRSHTVVEDTPSSAWKYLVYRVSKFGLDVVIKKGKRRELQNVKVVIENPQFESDDIIKSLGFDPVAFVKYQEDILSPELPPDTELIYTYGHRIRKYFGIDCLEQVIGSIKDGPDGRNCYITTWDNTKDILGKDRPCLVSLFFRKIDERLYLTVTFRTHNTASAWLENVYGLMAIQQYVCRSAGLSTGAITVFSHSISLNPKYLDKIKPICDEIEKTNAVRMDPNGYFLITTDGDDLVLKLCKDSVEFKEYRSKKPEQIQHMLYRDCAISDINHAIYVGRQIEKAFQNILNKTTYIQES